MSWLTNLFKIFGKKKSDKVDAIAYEMWSNERAKMLKEHLEKGRELEIRLQALRKRGNNTVEIDRELYETLKSKYPEEFI